MRMIPDRLRPARGSMASLPTPRASTPPLARDNTAPGPSSLAYRQPPLPRSPFDQHEPSVLVHPPPGKIHLVDLELEQRQALGFAHAICTDCVSMATVRRDGNPIGCTLGRIGHSWFGTIMAPTTSRTAPLPWGLVIRSGYPRRQLACEITNRRSDQLIRGGYWADTFPVDLFLGRAGSWP